jgi:hypothetical protein
VQRHVIDALALMVRKVTVVIELADTKVRPRFGPKGGFMFRCN